MDKGQQLLNFNSRATTRAGDPQTSKDAAERMNNSEAVEAHENDILRTLREHPGSTARELGLEMASKLSGVDKSTCEIIVDEYRKPHSRLSQMGNKVRIEPNKPANKYFAQEK